MWQSLWTSGEGKEVLMVVEVMVQMYPWVPRNDTDTLLATIDGRGPRHRDQYRYRCAVCLMIQRGLAYAKRLIYYISNLGESNAIRGITDSNTAINPEGLRNQTMSLP